MDHHDPFHSQNVLQLNMQVISEPCFWRIFMLILYDKIYPSPTQETDVQLEVLNRRICHLYMCLGASP